MKKFLFAVFASLVMCVSLSSFTVKTDTRYEDPDGDAVLILFKNGEFELWLDRDHYKGTYNLRREPQKGEVIPIVFTINGESETYNWAWPIYEKESVYIGDYALRKVN